MKINNSNISKGMAGLDTVKGKSVESDLGVLGTKQTKKNEAGADSARIDFSDRAQAMQRAKEIAGAEDQIDEAKIAKFQKLIDEGKYKVDARSVADRLVDEQVNFNE